MARGLKLAGQAVSVVLVAGLLTLLVWKLANQGDGGVASQLKRGKPVPAPAFTLPLLDGGTRKSLASYRGRPVVLNFFASWCVPCAQEAKTLEQGWQEWKPQGVVVLGVDWQDLTSDAKNFVSKYGVTYPVLRNGASGKIIADYGVKAVPETFFIDRKGRVVAHVALPVTEEDLSAGIQEALAG